MREGGEATQLKEVLQKQARKENYVLAYLCCCADVLQVCGGLHSRFVSLLEEISFNWHFYIYINSFKTLKCVFYSYVKERIIKALRYD